MKKTLLTLALATLSAVASYAQGTVAFANGTLTRAQWEDPATHAMVNVPASANIVYGIFWGRSADSLVLNDGALGTPHQTAISAGVIVAPNPYILNGAEPGERVFVKVAGWTSSFGRDFATASTTAGAHYGETGTKQILSLTGLGPTAGPGAVIWSASNTLLLQPLRIPIVPEPSVIALGVLGLGALLLRRKKA
jgi:hypothetical protein